MAHVSVVDGTEVLDSRHLPLCILPVAAARAQNLLHHEIMLFGLAGGRILLSCAKILDLPGFAALPAGLDNEEAAQAMSKKIFGFAPPVRHLADFLPSALTFGGIGHLFAAILSPQAAAALENPDLAPILPGDCPQLARRGLLAPIPCLLWAFSVDEGGFELDAIEHGAGGAAQHGC